MTPILIVLPLAALIASIISGIIGMGGGILLLAVILSFLDHGKAIPLHAIVQLSSNTTRALAFWKSADLSAVRRFSLGMLPGTVVGTLALYFIGKIEAGEPYLKIVVGLYVLIAPFVPKSKSVGDHADSSLRGFLPIGFLAGAMALTVGATGPLIAPIFARHGYVKERLIATKAVCQMLTHLVKLPAFLILGSFDVSASGGFLMLLMVLAVIPGTLIGKRLLKYVSPRLFVWMFKVALVVAGLKVLAVDGILQL